MGELRRLSLRLWNALRPSNGNDDLARELAAHIALLEDEYCRCGMTPDEAHRAARLALGGMTQTEDLHRDVRSFVWINDARRDAGYALRLLRRNPIMAATVCTSLAIGIGANTAVFTVANALLFRPPAGVAAPERLVDIGVSRGDGGFNPGSYPTYLDIRQRSTTLDGVIAYQMFPHAMTLRDRDVVERAFAHAVSMNYFRVLGATASAGRLFGDGDSEAPGASTVAVLSHRFWTRRYQRDPGVIGQTVRLNDRAFTVVGVAAEAFQGNGVTATDVWLPVTALDNDLSNRSSGWLVMGGRLKPGVSVAQAAAEVESIGRDLAREYPEQSGAKGLRVLPSSVVPGNRTLIAVFMMLLLAIVSVVLLVACANLSGILLARGAARRREIAVRLAIGAGRARLVRQLLMETGMLFALGAAAGVLLAVVVSSLVVRWLPSLPFPIAVSFALDGRVMAFTTGVSLIAALASGLTPALRASRADVVNGLKDEATAFSGRSRLRQTFVIAQVALSLLLVVVAGLFVRALERAGSIDPGFDPHHVELASIDLSHANYTETTGPRFARELVDHVRMLLGVETATLALVLPGGFETQRRTMMVPGATAPNGQRFFGVDWNAVEPGYFATLRIPLIAGRDFNAADRRGSELVAIVGEGSARAFWPGQDAVGKYVQQVVGRPGPAAQTRTLRVVGVARDVRASSLVDGLSRSPVYVPLQQNYLPTVTIVARGASGRPVGDAIRALLRSMDPNLTIVSSGTLEESLALGLVPQHVAASMSGSLGLVGLLLAAIGIYGITAYAVACRTREIGVRVALGARAGDVVRMILREGMTLTVAGAVIGLLLAAGASRVLAVFLFGMPPFDPVTFTLAAGLFVAAGLVACYVPVRRATRIHAMEALRYE